MYETLFFKNVHTNEVVAFLKGVNMGSRLESLRARITSEITILANDEFGFIIGGTTIKNKQEKNVKSVFVH